MTDQEKFDGLLAECDSCLRRIGILPCAYLPSVRLTHNRSRIGSCKKLAGGRKSLFQISCSVDACKTDAQVRDRRPGARRPLPRAHPHAPRLL